MALNKNPTLHVVHSATTSQNSIFLKGKSTTELWNDFINFCDFICTGFQYIIRLDLESSFTLEQLRQNAKYFGIDF